MAKDFRASQIEASKLIASGGISGNGLRSGAKLGLAIYSGSQASNREGGISDSAMFSGVGKDVFLFISGSKSNPTRGAHSENQDAVVLFGGDVVVSGTLYAERQVIEVDSVADGNFYVTGNMYVEPDANSTTSVAFRNAAGDNIFVVDTTNGDVKVVGAEPKLIIGDADAEDTYLVFDGNAQDYRIGLDDGTDTLEIGVGAAHGSTTAIKINASAQVHVEDAFAANVGGEIGTLANSATPSVATGNLWQTGGTTTIEDFTGGIAGQTITVVSKHTVTFDVTDTGLKGGSTDIPTVSGDITVWTYDGTDWYLVQFMDSSENNATDQGGGSLDDAYDTASGGASTGTGLGAIIAVDGVPVQLQGSGTVLGLTGSLMMTGSLYASADIELGEYIKHKDDEHTYIRFTDDRIRFNAGNIEFFDLSEDGGNSELIINGASQPIDTLIRTNSSRQIGIKVDATSRRVLILSGGGETSPKESAYPDLNFFVSGAIGSRGSLAGQPNEKGTSVFGGDVMVSGSLVVENGTNIGGTISGSIHLTDTGVSYLVAGDNITIASASNGQVTITAGAGTGEWTDIGSWLHPKDNVNEGVIIGGTSIGQADIVLKSEGGAIFNEQAQSTANADFKVKLSTTQNAIHVDTQADKVLILSGGAGTSLNEEAYADTTFFVSGSMGSRGKEKGTSLFGGDVAVSGSTYLLSSLTVHGHIMPGDDDAYDLGTTGAAWQDLHLEGDVLMTDAGKVETTAGDLTISSADGQVIVDAETDIILDAKGNDIILKSNGTEIGRFANSSNDLVIKSTATNKDIIFQEDGGNEVFRLDSNVETLAINTDKKLTFDGASSQSEFILGDGTNLQIGSSNRVLILSGGAENSPNESAYPDTNFFVSGAIGSSNTTVKGTSVFGGDTVISGALLVENGTNIGGTISGSIHLTDTGISYLVAGDNITIASASNGQVTITGTAASEWTDEGPVLRPADDAAENVGIGGTGTAADAFDIYLNSAGGATFNEQGQGGVNSDFRVETNTKQHAFFIDSQADKVLILSGSDSTGNSPNESAYPDLAFFVSGTIDSKNTSNKGASLFGGDVVISGALYMEERSSPGTIADGTVAFYGKDNSGVTTLWYKNESGETEIANTQNDLDQAYDQGGAGKGRIINADSGAVEIDASGAQAGLVITGSNTGDRTLIEFYKGSSALDADIRYDNNRNLIIQNNIGAAAKGHIILNPSHASSNIVLGNTTGVTKLAFNGNKTTNPGGPYISTSTSGDNANLEMNVKANYSIKVNSANSATDFTVGASGKGSALLVDGGTNQVSILTRGSYASQAYGLHAQTDPIPVDTGLFVSGAIDGVKKHTKGITTFGGDMYVSGGIYGAFTETYTIAAEAQSNSGDHKREYYKQWGMGSTNTSAGNAFVHKAAIADGTLEGVKVTLYNGSLPANAGVVVSLYKQSGASATVPGQLPGTPFCAMTASYSTFSSAVATNLLSTGNNLYHKGILFSSCSFRQNDMLRIALKNEVQGSNPGTLSMTAEFIFRYKGYSG